MSTELRTDGISTEATTSEGWTSRTPGSLLPQKTFYIVLGVIGALTNGLVLLSIGLSGRSKMTSTMVHIANHTTLERSIHLKNYRF